MRGSMNIKVVYFSFFLYVHLVLLAIYVFRRHCTPTVPTCPDTSKHKLLSLYNTGVGT